MNILFTTIMYNRPKVSELYILGLERLKKIKNFDVLAIVSDDASLGLCKRYGIEHYYHENLPLGKKHNFMLQKCLEKDFDYLIHSGDDDVMSNELFLEYLKAFEQGYEYIKPQGLYFFDIATKRGLNFNPQNTFGAFRCFKRSMLDKFAYQCVSHFFDNTYIGGKCYLEGNKYSLPKYLAEYYKEKNRCSILSCRVELWNDELNKGLDFSSESKLIECGVILYIVKTDKPQVIDFKSDQNIWKFEKYYTQATDAKTEDILAILSNEEINYLESF